MAQYVARHYIETVEPLGYKAFLVGVDREACAHYKEALDAEFEKHGLPPEYSEVVYTGNNNDSALLKKFHLDPTRERQIRKSFCKLDQQPKILIVTEKLLTGFDAPVLYAMYLDKPMRDHALLQAIARVNRPYENEAEKMVKPQGFILDFVGMFDKLEKALAFDSDEVNAIVKDIKLLKILFQDNMRSKAPEYLALIERNFNDKDVDTLIEHFRDPERRKEFFKKYKEIEMLYEIISPDAFMQPFMEDYATLSAIYGIVRKAYTQQVVVDRDFQRKTNQLVQNTVGSYAVGRVDGLIEINAGTIELINNTTDGKGTRVINLVKSIAKSAEESSDPNLIAMAERAQAVRESFESRQINTTRALEELKKEIENNEARKKEQAEKGLDDLTYLVYGTLRDAGVKDAETVSQKFRQAFSDFSQRNKSENAFRELRSDITLAIYAETDDSEPGRRHSRSIVHYAGKGGANLISWKPLFGNGPSKTVFITGRKSWM